MAILAAGTSTAITLPPNALLKITGTGTAVLGPGRRANQQIGLQGDSVIGPFEHDQVVYLSATTRLSYVLDLDPSDMDLPKFAFDSAGSVMGMIPTAMNKKILVIGSSTPAGRGSSTGEVGADGVPTAKSWVGLLAAKLADHGANNDGVGWEVVNGAVSGLNMSTPLASFYSKSGASLRSPALERPAIVALGMTLGNEGLTSTNSKGANEQVARQFVRRVLQYRERVRQLGAKLVLTNQFGRDEFDAATYECVKFVNAELEANGIPMVDFRGVLDTGTGPMRPSLRADAFHANDSGHAGGYRAWSVSFLDRLPDYVYPPRRPTGPRGFTVPAGVNTGSTGAPAVYTTTAIGEIPFGSWTLAFKIKSTGADATNYALAAFYDGGGNGFRLRNAATGIELVFNSNNAVLVSDTGYIPASNAAEQDIAISYDWCDNLVSLWRNGILIAKSATPFAAAGTLVDFTRFAIGGRTDNLNFNAIGYTFRDIALYRSALTAEQIDGIARGIYPAASLEIFSPCDDAAFKTGYRIRSDAPTAAAFTVQTNADLTAAKLT